MHRNPFDDDGSWGVAASDGPLSTTTNATERGFPCVAFLCLHPSEKPCACLCINHVQVSPHFLHVLWKLPLVFSTLKLPQGVDYLKGRRARANVMERLFRDCLAESELCFAMIASKLARQSTCTLTCDTTVVGRGWTRVCNYALPSSLAAFVEQSIFQVW